MKIPSIKSGGELHHHHHNHPWRLSKIYYWPLLHVAQSIRSNISVFQRLLYPRTCRIPSRSRTQSAVSKREEAALRLQATLVFCLLLTLFLWPCYFHRLFLLLVTSFASTPILILIPFHALSTGWMTDVWSTIRKARITCRRPISRCTLRSRTYRWQSSYR